MIFAFTTRFVPKIPISIFITKYVNIDDRFE